VCTVSKILQSVAGRINTKFIPIKPCKVDWLRLCSDYATGLRNGVPFAAGQDFCLPASVQTSSSAHQICCPTGTGILPSEIKRPEL
jgi:hypothetical protein